MGEPVRTVNPRIAGLRCVRWVGPRVAGSLGRHTVTVAVTVTVPVDWRTTSERKGEWRAARAILGVS